MATTGQHRTKGHFTQIKDTSPLEKSSHTEPPYLGCYPRYQTQKGPHHKRCLLNYLRHQDNIYRRIGLASFGVTDPQDYHPLVPSLHHVVNSCELHIKVPLVQKYAKSECAYSSGNSQKQPTDSIGGAVEDLRKVVVEKKNQDSSGQKVHLFGAHLFAHTGRNRVCPELFGGPISQLLLPGLPFIGFIFHAISLSTFGSPYCVSMWRPAPVTHLILIC